MPMHLEATTDFVYVPFHGLKGGSAHDYPDHKLEPWVGYLRRCDSARPFQSGVHFWECESNGNRPTR